MRKTWTLVKKEILDILRDKKTLVIMVAVPILLYPAIIIGMVLVMNFMMQSREGGSYTAAYAERYKAEALRLQEVYEEKKEELDISLTFLEVPEKEKGDGKSSYDVWINFVTDGQGLHIEVEYTSTDSDSSYAENALEELADIYCKELLEDKLGEKGLTVDFL